MKKAFVTGASKGIGLSVAKELVAMGYEVIGVYNSTKPSDIENITYIKIDLTNRQEVLDRIKELSIQHKFDCIVNCAGIFTEESVDDFDLNKWDVSFQLMVTTPYIITQILSGDMKSGGAVVNVSSTDANTGALIGFGYSAAKAALNNLTKSLGNVLGKRGIRVNAVAPGWVDTDMGPDTASLKAAVEKNTPLGRVGRDYEVAKLVAFLVSKDASYINGEIITIDGGMSNIDSTLLEEAED